MDSPDRPDDNLLPASTEPANHSAGGLRDVLLFLPRFAALLGKLIADPEVSSTDKLLLVAVVAYMLSPFDIIPDIVPVLGQLDDAYLVALCLLRLLNHSGEAKVRQHWDGPEDIVQILQTISDYATRYLPAPARNALRGWIDVRTVDAGRAAAPAAETPAAAAAPADTSPVDQRPPEPA